MSSIKNNSVKTFIIASAFLALFAGVSNAATKNSVNTLHEPDPAQAIVYSEPGLGASDALGHALFIEDGARFAQANSVYEMAAAEQPGLKLRGAVYNTPGTMPEQVIVSAEDLHRQLLAEGKTWPAAAALAVSSVDVED